MKIKSLTIIFFTVALFVSCTFKQPIYTVEVFKVKNGWGYSIFEKKKLIIKQDFIPSINYKTPFKTKNDAETIGLLVIEKLNQHKIPSITQQELQNKLSLNIQASK
jgi:hypothetical protein